MKKKNIFFSSVIVTILVILVVFFILQNSTNNQNNNDKTITIITVSVFDKENKEIYNKTIETEEKYLSEIMEKNKELDVKMENSTYGKYITSILGLEQGNNYYWSYYINGEYANIGISNCELEQNKIYTFKIEKFEY